MELFTDEKPLTEAHLSNYAKKMRKDQTNFLTFGKSVPHYVSVEYAKAAEKVDWARQLDDTFAVRGVEEFRYNDVANPFAEGQDPWDMGPGTHHIEHMRADKKFMGMPVKKKEEKAEAAKYIRDTVNQTKRYDNVQPIAYDEPYDDYGYKEMGFKESSMGGALTMFTPRKKKEKETAAFAHDIKYCPEGSTWVAGECIPFANNLTPVCPYDFELNKDGRCQLAKNKEFNQAEKMQGEKMEGSDEPTYAIFLWSPGQAMINFLVIALLIAVIVSLVNRGPSSSRSSRRKR